MVSGSASQMRNALGIVATAVLIASLLPPASFAQRPQDMVRCEGKESASTPDMTIRGCTALIQSGDFSSETLARTFPNRAHAYRVKGDLDRAIQDFTEAIRRNPQDATTIEGRANAYLKKRDFDRAIRDYDDVIRLDPRRRGLYRTFHDRATAYLEKRDFDRAIADYDHAIRSNPLLANFIGAFYNRCRAHAFRGNFREALADCNESLRLRTADAFETRGLVYLKLNRPVDAITDFDAALRLNPKRAHALYGRCLGKQKNGDGAGAAADIAAAKVLQADIEEKFKSHGLR